MDGVIYSSCQEGISKFLTPSGNRVWVGDFLVYISGWLAGFLVFEFSAFFWSELSEVHEDTKCSSHTSAETKKGLSH